MPYVPPGASSQSCIPRKAIASTVLEQTRRKVAAAGKSNSTSTSGGSEEDKQIEANGTQASTSRTAPASGVDMYAATSQLADDLGAAHIDQPEITIPKSVSSSSLAPSSSDAPSSSVSPTLSTSAKSHSGSDSDAVIAYKTALYTYTRDKLLETKGTGSPGKKAQSAYAQFGSKQSGMQKLAAKKLLARQLNA